jgi:hypothetical protein
MITFDSAWLLLGRLKGKNKIGGIKEENGKEIKE